MILTICLCLLFEPSWMTNDDAAMSMIAHGYGAISQASYKLIFSHIYWGKIIQSIPTINGMYGYSFATLFTIILSGTFFSIILNSLNVNPIINFLVISLILFEAILFPQFTITAGLATVAAILCLKKYTLQPKLTWLITACVFLIVGYLIRKEEALLLCIIAIPLIAWHKLIRNTAFNISFIALLIFIAITTIENKNAYLNSDWDRYNNFLPIASQFVAYDAEAKLAGRTELLKKHQLNQGDIDAIKNWLWFDNTITDIKKLQALLNDMNPSFNLPFGFQHISQNWQEKIIISIKALGNKYIVFMFIMAICMLITAPSRSLFLSWFLFVLAITFMGSLGRPGILRVYFPVIALLLLTPFFNIRQTKAKKYAILIFLIICTTSHALVITSASTDRYEKSVDMRKKLALLPKNEVISGYYSTFKANHTYAVTSAANLRNKYNNLYLFGWPAITPYSVATKLENQGQGFKNKLFSTAGVWVLINDESVLSQYCTDRGRQIIHIEEKPNFRSAKKIKCEEIL